MVSESKKTKPRLNQHKAAYQALDLIADKWTVLVVYALQDGCKRLSELTREVEGASQKMLIQTLRKMERDGLVERKVFPVVPPKVEYSLSPLGESLTIVTSALCHWARENIHHIKAARESYDAQRTSSDDTQNIDITR